MTFRFDRTAIRTLAAGLVLSISPFVVTTAQAHHPMGGTLPATWAQGLLSGLGHPIIGIDHLAFIVGIGLLAAVAGFGPLLPVMFVAAMAGGLALHVAAIDLPGVELAIAASVALIGLALLRPTFETMRASRRLWLEGGVFAAAGVFHGYALAESIIGAEPTPLVAYIAGLVVCQSAIALGAFTAVGGIAALTQLHPEPRLATVRVRAAGLAIFAVGALFAAHASGLTA